MQSPVWYFHRLRSMSAAEVGWRLAMAARRWVDRARVASGVLPSRRRTDRLAAAYAAHTDAQLTDIKPGTWRDQPPGEAPMWLTSLVSRADAIRHHRLSLFGQEHDLGTPIQWNPAQSARVARRFSGAIDYRDVGEVGDAKVVWEPNRHQHLTVLARAYRATGDIACADAVAAQLASWIAQCPFGRGMQWRSPLELAIRAINWTFALDLISGSTSVKTALWADILHALDLHVWEIARNYSRGSSANNHLIGEAAGVFIVTSYFRDLPDAQRHRDESFGILVEESARQFFADGGHREQATGYHLFVLELLMLPALVGRHTGTEFPERYWKQLEAAVAFVAGLGEGGPVPFFGDADDGYVLDRGAEVNAALALGALLFDRPDFKSLAGPLHEAAHWLIGADAPRRWAVLPDAAERALSSRAFPDSGYYVLQSGGRGADSISAIIDCGPLGFTAIAAHGHADALSLVLRAFGHEILIDPGTYDYFTYPQWREYFRSTRAHNTITVDGVDQSVQRGLFLWGSKAAARCIAWQPGRDGGRISMSHDGYTRLAAPVAHQRAVELDGLRRVLQVSDQLQGAGHHRLDFALHFAEECQVTPDGENEWIVSVSSHRLRVVLDKTLTTVCCHGADAPIAGWISRGYHRKEPTTTIVGSRDFQHECSITCRFEFERA
jgi:hypothetical protein